MKTSFHPLAPAALLAVAAVVFAACVGWRPVVRNTRDKIKPPDHVLIVGGLGDGANALPLKSPTTLAALLATAKAAGFGTVSDADLANVQISQATGNGSDVLAAGKEEAFAVSKKIEEAETKATKTGGTWTSQDATRTARNLSIQPGAVIYVPEPTCDGILVVLPDGAHPSWLRGSGLPSLKQQFESIKGDDWVTVYRGLLAHPLQTVMADSVKVSDVVQGKPAVVGGDVVVVTHKLVYGQIQVRGAPAHRATQWVAVAPDQVVVMGDIGGVKAITAGDTAKLANCLDQAAADDDCAIRQAPAQGLGYYWDGRSGPLHANDPAAVTHDVRAGDTIVVCRPQPFYAEILPNGDLQLKPCGGGQMVGFLGDERANIIRGVLGVRRAGASPPVNSLAAWDVGSSSVVPGDLVIKFFRG